MKDNFYPPFSIGLLADIILAFIATFIGLEISGAASNSHFIFKIFVFFSSILSLLIVTKSWQSVWKWTGFDDIIKILQVNILSSILYLLICFFKFHELLFDEAIFVYFILISLMVGARGFVRLVASGGNIITLAALLRPVDKNAPAAILVGETEVVTNALHEIRKQGTFSFKPIAIISTKGNHIGKVFAGAKVFSGEKFDKLIKEISEEALENYDDVRIILVGNSHSAAISQSVLSLIQKTKVKLARLPEFGSKELKNVSPFDVLGRKHHNLDFKGPSHLIKHKTVLITGAGGTIGSEIAKQVASFSPSCIILLDNSEENLYEVDQKIKDSFPSVKRVAKLKDVKEKDQIDLIFKEYNPQIIFHAAANKHVPILEFHPREAILTNIYGTKNVADAALQNGAEIFVLISTDKAVNPSNIMGCAKRIAELYTRYCFNKACGHFYAVRFGNVLGSSGSVMPLFERQIKRGGPLTVTDFNMTRWFMTVEEASGLVLQGAALGAGYVKDDLNEPLGEPLLVLDMGEPMKIVDFAKDMVRLKGLEPDKDIKIIESGIRPGEKLHEELFYKSERVSKTLVDGVLCAKPTSLLNENLIDLIDDCVKAAKQNDIEGAVTALSKIVPEYKPSNPVRT